MKVKAKWLVRHLPRWSDTIAGISLFMLGLLMLNEGGFALQVSPEVEPHWVFFPAQEAWVCWVIICLGLDSMVSGGRIIPFVLNKALIPLLRRVIENIRGVELGTKE